MIRQDRTAEHYPLRLPGTLKEKIRSAAQQSGRSMNSEIVFQLVAIFEDNGRETEKADAQRA